MPEVAFVMSARQHYPLSELARTLKYELELQAVPSSVHLGGFPEPRPSLVYVLLDPSGYAAAEGKQAIPGEGILRRTIFLCDEPPPLTGDDDHVALLKRAGALFVLDQRSVVALHRLGIPARLLRPGYSKSLDRFDPNAARPIDVMFLGRHSLRRTRYLARAAPVLSRHNCLLQVAEDAPSPGDTSSFLAQGRWPLLAQTKVVISLHRGDGSRFDWRGALDAIHCGAVVVTEHSSGIAPLVPGEHLLVTGGESLPYVVDDVLRDAQRLARLRAQAYERLSTWLPYALSVAILRAAAVELVGEPLPSEASLGKLALETSAAGSAPTSQVEKHRGPDVEPFAPGVRSVQVTHESSAWTARRAPLMTVVTVLSGPDEQITATLESLAHSRLSDFELVVVAAGSSQHGQRVAATDWLLQHPRLATRLVVTDESGLGAARNIALDFALGAFCLILDPGQEIYPRCLEVLAGTLEAMPEVAFVYPVLEVTGTPDGFVEAGGDYLMSFFGWDPGRLRRGTYIHAPALIRTGWLRQLGGFATASSLHGFEDYDLWCRMADRGWRGQLVPQVLARRTESASSQTLSAIHPASGAAITALMERAPQLMSGAFPSPPAQL